MPNMTAYVFLIPSISTVHDSDTTILMVIYGFAKSIFREVLQLPSISHKKIDKSVAPDCWQPLNWPRLKLVENLSSLV